MSFSYHKTKTSLFAPTSPKGYVYYAKLKTEHGTFYKLGFTTHDSVKSRLEYKGKGDEKYLDKVFLFTYDENAYSIEQKLHNYFDHKKAFYSGSARDRPLYGNGQSELYESDILGLDRLYKPESSPTNYHHAKINLEEFRKSATEDTAVVESAAAIMGIWVFWLRLTQWPRRLMQNMESKHQEKLKNEAGIVKIVNYLKSNSSHLIPEKKLSTEKASTALEQQLDKTFREIQKSRRNGQKGLFVKIKKGDRSTSKQWSEQWLKDQEAEQKALMDELNSK